MKYQRHCPGCFQDKNGLPVCPVCGYDESVPRGPVFLSHGAMIGGQYRVGRVLGRPGGFGITYLGWDVNLQKRVAIKEYLPRELASRVPDSDRVRTHTPEDQKGFDFGKEQFLREARIVAQFDHPNIVRVLNFFNANETAYLVMDYYEGMTLGDYLTQVRVTIEPEVSVPLLKPILDGLQYVHERGVVHRDVKPHNIYLARVGRPILLDFGAARQAVGDRVASLSVVLTEGYAPLEQYQRKAAQGPWTDVYGVAATLYRMIEGSAPPVALDRLSGDPLDLARLVNVPVALAPILRKALAVRPEERYANAAEFRRALDSESALGDGSASTATMAAAPVNPNPRIGAGATAAPPSITTPVSAPTARRDSTPKPPPAAAPPVAAAAAPAPKPVTQGRWSPDPAPTPASSPATRPAVSRSRLTPATVLAPIEARLRASRTPLLAGAAVVLLAIVSVGYVVRHPAAGPRPAGPAAVDAAVIPPAAASVAAAASPADRPTAPTAPAKTPTPRSPLGANDPSMPEFVDVPAGDFTLGDTVGTGFDDERPTRHAQVAGFSMSLNEITVAQFRRFIERSGYYNPVWTAIPCQNRSGSSQAGSPTGVPQGNDIPVVCVGFADALAYAAWLSSEAGRVYRLPTEAEWEYATRARSSTAYWWGAQLLPGRATCSDCLPAHIGPTPVRSYPPNAFGLYDTAGNVREWTCSVYGGYDTDQAARCATPAPNSRMSVRGGDWAEPATMLRSSARGAELPDHRDNWTGFRLVSDAVPATATGTAATASTPAQPSR